MHTYFDGLAQNLRLRNKVRDNSELGQERSVLEGESEDSQAEGRLPGPQPR